MKQIARIRTVVLRVVRGHLEEPRIILRSQHAAELSRERAAGAMHELVRQHDGGREIVFAFRQQRRCQGGHARVVGLFRLAGVEADRQIAAPCEHDMVPLGVLVDAVGERTHERPLFGYAREIRQMLADVGAGGAGADGFELTAVLHRRVRLHVEALMLCQSAGEEDVDHRLCAGRLRRSRHGLQSAEMIHAESQQSDRARLNHFTAAVGMSWMRQGHAP